MRELLNQSFLRYPLTSVLGTPGNVKVLRVLARHGGALSAPRMAAETGMSGPGVRAALEALVVQHVVQSLGSGRSRLYALKRSHPIAAALTMLFDAENQHWEAINAELKEAVAKDRRIHAAWLYGSVARGTDGPDSDVDILVVTDDGLIEEVVRDVRDRMLVFERTYDVVVSVIAHTQRELAELTNQDNAWWANVRREGRQLAGSPAYRLPPPTGAASTP